MLDFVFDAEKAEPEQYRYDVKLTAIKTCKLFYTKLMSIYLAMPQCTKSLTAVRIHFEQWL